MEKNERNSFRAWIHRLNLDDSLEVMIEVHTYVTEAAFVLIRLHGNDPSDKPINHDANLLLQMTALKSISLKPMSVPKDYKVSADGTMVRGINDPFGMMCLVRSQMEAFCTFNNMFINSDSDSERQMKYDLWVLAGLKYRQRFPVKLPEHLTKKDKEAKEIDDIQEAIKLSDIYIALGDEGKKTIDYLIKSKEWKFLRNSDNIKSRQWHEALTDSGANDMLEQKYTFLSLGSHPSNVSVFQFGQMFVEQQHKPTARMALLYSTIFMSFFIRDYVVHFNLRDTHFKNLPLKNQMLVNWYNRAFRGKDYQVNDALSLLD